MEEYLMDGAKIRVEVELQELSNRLNSLIKFMTTDNFKSLNADSRKLLAKQANVMSEYETILKQRLAVWETKDV